MKFSKAQQNAMNVVADAMSAALVEFEKYQFACQDEERTYVLDNGVAIRIKVNVENVNVVTE